MNVILISLDTLRADHMSCYGYHRLTTPHIDKIASQGVLFSQCYSQFIPTHPGHTTLFTGRDVFAHQVIAQGSPKVELDLDIKQLAEILQEEGYFTAAADNLGRWFSRGFEVYETYSWDTDTSIPWRKAEAVNQASLSVLDQAHQQDRPFFLFLHYWDPHTPYLPPEPFTRMFYSRHLDETDPRHISMEKVWDDYPALNEYFGQWLGGFGKVKDADYLDALYDAEIAYMDAALTELFTRLEELNRIDDTLLIILSDHGEELHEHDYCWWDHHGLYETNIHVPLIVKLPGQVPAGSHVDGFVGLQDIAPTVLSFLGLDHLSGQHSMDGKSVTPLVGRRSRRGLRQEMYLAEGSWMRKYGWRNRDWKLIVSIEDPFDLPSVELYDMRGDPEETRNLAEERPEVVAQLRQRAERWQRRRIRETGQPDPHSYQEITLRHIGAQQIERAIPKDQKLGEEE